MVKKIVKKTVTETTEDDGSKKTVVKEHAPKTTASKRTYTKRTSKPDAEKRMTAKEREELLIENFVGLQHAMTNMSIKFGSLSDNISKLLSVFEEAAKGFVVGDKTNDKDMLNKIDSLLDQNKTIAKGLVLMEERVRTRVQNSEEAKAIASEAKAARPDIKERNVPHEMKPSMESRNNPSANLRPKPLPRI